MCCGQAVNLSMYCFLMAPRKYYLMRKLLMCRGRCMLPIGENLLGRLMPQISTCILPGARTRTGSMRRRLWVHQLTSLHTSPLRRQARMVNSIASSSLRDGSPLPWLLKAKVYTVGTISCQHRCVVSHLRPLIASVCSGYTSAVAEGGFSDQRHLSERAA